MFDTVTFNLCCHSQHRPVWVVFHFSLPADVVVQPEQSGSQEKRYQCRRRIKEAPDVATSILTEQFCTVSIAAFKDSRGKTVKVSDTPQWATDNSDLVTIEPAADGMSCKVTTGLMTGAAKVQMSVDADPGEAVSTIVGTAEFTITALNATTVALQVDTPADVPEPPVPTPP